MATITPKALIKLEVLYIEENYNQAPEIINQEWLILGITADGKTFRPSDWAERLCGAIAQYNDGRLIYSDLAYPITRNGQIGVVVETKLKSENPVIYSFLMNFARDNRLKIISGREIPRPIKNPNTVQTKLPLRLVI